MEHGELIDPFFSFTLPFDCEVVTDYLDCLRRIGFLVRVFMR